VAKHSVDLAEVVVEAEIFPKILTCLKFPDNSVRKYGATAVREVSTPHVRNFGPKAPSSNVYRKLHFYYLPGKICGYPKDEVIGTSFRWNSCGCAGCGNRTLSGQLLSKTQ
jgi:hypothetical protein